MDDSELRNLREESLVEFAEGFGNGDFEWQDVKSPPDISPETSIGIFVDFDTVAAVEN